MSNTNGSKWCRPQTRLAIYLRDGLACMWCGETLASGAQLTLDHVVPRSRGGSNGPRNLVTCCLSCNSRRADRSVRSFLKWWGPADRARAYRNVRNALRRTLPRVQAAELIASRGSVSRVLGVPAQLELPQ